MPPLTATCGSGMRAWASRSEHPHEAGCLEARIANQPSRMRLLQCICPLLAQSGHARRVGRCPLMGVKRTSNAQIELVRF
jgi:hypothetical protein